MRSNFTCLSKTGKLVALAFGLSLVLSSVAKADSLDVADTVSTGTVSTGTVLTDGLKTVEKIDTVLFVPPADVAAAATVISPFDLEQNLYQQPTVALFKSLFVPGLGQLGNHRYIKAAFFAGMEAWFISSAIKYRNQARDARDLFDKETNRDRRNALWDVYDDKRVTRNKYTWYAGITIFVSMFDAYVDAHLSGSPADKRNDKFSFDIISDDVMTAGAAVSYNF